MESWILWFLFVLAIAAGWWLGRRERKRPQSLELGLQYLLNDQQDQAVAALVGELEFLSDNVETHLALGGLLRRRGELERAVVVHESILSRTRLDTKTRHEVEIELARDYLQAGLLDRAEALSLQLAKENPKFQTESLKITLSIYEQEREWEKAIETAKLMLGGANEEQIDQAISHYYCEQAEQLFEAGNISAARDAISGATGHLPRNPRVSLIQAKMELHEGRFDQAIKVLKRLPEQDVDFVPEALLLLKKTYQLGGFDLGDYRAFLESCLNKTSSISIVLAVAEIIKEVQGDEAAAKYIANYLKKNPTLRGLTQLIDLHVENAHGISKQNLYILRSFAEALAADKPAYRCIECGFEGKRLNWRCPSCKKWSSTRPIFGLEGE